MINNFKEIMVKRLLLYLIKSLIILKDKKLMTECDTVHLPIARREWYINNKSVVF